MRVTRALPVAVVVVLIGTTVLALTLPVTFPTRTTRAKLQVLVDEGGNVLFGGMPGKVEVTSLPQVIVQPALPSARLQKMTFVTDSSPNARLTNDFVPATQSFAITSLTFANLTGVNLSYLVSINQPASPTTCEDAITTNPLLSVSIRPGETQHLTFPQPLIASPDASGGVWCLIAQSNNTVPPTGSSMFITVVGYAL